MRELEGYLQPNLRYGQGVVWGVGLVLSKKFVYIVNDISESSTIYPERFSTKIYSIEVVPTYLTLT